MSLISFEDLLNPKELFDMLKYEHRARKYDRMYKNYKKKIGEAEKLEEEPINEEPETEEEEIERVEGEVVMPDKIRKFAYVSNLVFNETKGRFEYSTPKEDYSMFYTNGEIEEPFIEDLPKLEPDDIENIVSYVVRDVKRLNPDMSDSLIRHTVLTILYLGNVISNYELKEHCDNNDPDRYTEINSIGKFLFNGFKIFLDQNCYDVSEFISMKELKDIINSLDTKLNWTGNEDYIDIVNSVRKGYTANKNKENLFNGVEPVDESPILFNNAVLSQGIGDIDNPNPRLNSKVVKLLKKMIGNILKDDKSFTFDILPATDNYNPDYILRDVGQAVIKCVNTDTGAYCLYSIDLNTIVGNGYNLIMPTNFNGIIQDIYVNIEKHPDIIRKILTTNYQFKFNNTNVVDLELRAVMSDCMPYPAIYKQYDFSDMYKYLKDLSEEDKVILTNNLVGIINLNWYNISPGFVMPRFRFREFTNARKFILVSDKNVRVQSSNWMSEPFSLYAKQYINSEGYLTDDSELVVDLDNNDIRIYVNKTEVNL